MSSMFDRLLRRRNMGPAGIEFRGYAGMSYHGGLIGVILVGFWFCRKHKVNFWNLADLFAPVFPLGYTFGRLGNFINGELWGRTTDAGIGMYFPDAPGDILRHPSQLYEATFEGLFLFASLWLIRNIKKPEGANMAAYIFGYGFVRFFIEFFREPDAHLGTVLIGFSMGQVLCFLMMSGAAGLYFYLMRREKRIGVIGATGIEGIFTGDKPTATSGGALRSGGGKKKKR